MIFWIWQKKVTAIKANGRTSNEKAYAQRNHKQNKNRTYWMTDDICRSYTNEVLISTTLKFIQLYNEKRKTAKNKIQTILLKTGLGRKCQYTFFSKVDTYIHVQQTHEKCSTSLKLGKCKSKPQWHITSHLAIIKKTKK